MLDFPCGDACVHVCWHLQYVQYMCACSCHVYRVVKGWRWESGQVEDKVEVILHLVLLRCLQHISTEDACCPLLTARLIAKGPAPWFGLTSPNTTLSQSVDTARMVIHLTIRSLHFICFYTACMYDVWVVVVLLAVCTYAHSTAVYICTYNNIAHTAVAQYLNICMTLYI